MKQYKGFTLIELLVSMVLLTFVILISSSLFDIDIQMAPKLGKTIKENSETISKIENAVADAKNFTVYISGKDKDSKLVKPANFVDRKRFKLSKGFKIKGYEFNSVVGYLISVDKSSSGFSVNINNLQNNPYLVTFVSGYGYDVTPKSKVDSFYMDNKERFIFYPLKEGKSKTNGISAYYKVLLDENIQKFKDFRAKLIKSKNYKENENIITTPYSDSNEDAEYNLTVDDFEKVNPELIISKSREGKIKYDVGVNSIKKYLDFIDRSYAYSGYTTNSNGIASEEFTTFVNDSEAGQTVEHYIGIPYVKDILGLYDTDLMLSKGDTSTGNKYYWIFDENNKTKYSDRIKVENDKNFFNWDNIDTRNLIGINFDNTSNYNGQPQNISVENGFYHNGDARKPYGYSLYYPQDKYIVNYSIPENQTRSTFIIKFNPNSYNKRFLSTEDTGDYVLFSYNMTLDGQLEKEMADTKNERVVGMMVYADKYGNIKEHLIKTPSKKDKTGKNVYIEEDKDLGYNILKDTNLYTDTNNYKFKQLTQKSGANGNITRQDFNIMGIVISQEESNYDGYVTIFFLDRDTNVSDKIQTRLKPVIVREGIKLDEKNFHFGGNIKALKDVSVNEAPENSAMEISDIMYFPIDLEAGQSTTTTTYVNSSSYLSKNMDYLYRKYLLSSDKDDSERANFDEFFSKHYGD